MRKGSKTFHFASRFMSRERRNSFYAIYAFCRHTDNLVDDNEGNPRLQKLLIRDWKRRFLEAYRQGYSSDPILNPLVHVMKKHSIPLRYPLELIKGVSMDIHKKEYGTFSELRTYCYRVASVVGIMLMYVMGIKNLRKAKKYATKLGIAMQLTNILRDVGEDARMGRVYFPKDELKSFGLRISDILKFHKTASLIRFLKFQIARARKYYQQAMAGLAMIHREVRIVIALAFTLYREILDVIEENEYEVFGKRAYVNTFRKVMLYLRLIVIGYPPEPAPA
ncbi:MAG TPA: phytoene/squalene synthase family protein [Candidatus Bilamarchaeum sp.]|nr:phytoene/squalene synthase family protein [Candidatus Bilamarchaeum sp.]